MIKMNLKKLALQIHRDNVRKGFWKKPQNEGEKIWLVVTELAEATEAHREYRWGAISEFESALKMQSKFRYPKRQALEIKIDLFKKHVKDSVGDEFADAFIRMLDYCHGFKVRVNEVDIFRRAKYMQDGGFKFENLGEELLHISGLLARLTTDREFCAMLVFARLMWLSDKLNIPLEKHIKYKIWYNSTRPKMHGKKY